MSVKRSVDNQCAELDDALEVLDCRVPPESTGSCDYVDVSLVLVSMFRTSTNNPCACQLANNINTMSKINSNSNPTRSTDNICRVLVECIISG